MRDGLRIASPDGSVERYRLPVIAPHALGGQVDLCLLAVKSYDTEAALRRVLPHLAPDGLVVSLQNSINEEWIAPRVGASSRRCRSSRTWPTSAMPARW